MHWYKRNNNNWNRISSSFRHFANFGLLCQNFPSFCTQNEAPFQPPQPLATHPQPHGVLMPQTPNTNTHRRFLLALSQI